MRDVLTRESNRVFCGGGEGPATTIVLHDEHALQLFLLQRQPCWYDLDYKQQQQLPSYSVLKMGTLHLKRRHPRTSRNMQE